MGRPGRPPKDLIPADGEDQQLFKPMGKGNVKKNIDHSLKLSNLPKLTKEQKWNPAIVEERCQLYLRLCGEQNVKPSNIGLAVAFRIDRKTLYNAKHEGWGAESAEVLKHYANIIDLNLTNLAMDGDVYAQYAEFLQKNNAGYSDRTEITVEKGTTLLTKDELIKRADAIPSDEPITTDFTEKPQNAENNPVA